jgi:hypothetical protein
VYIATMRKKRRENQVLSLHINVPSFKSTYLQNAGNVHLLYSKKTIYLKKNIYIYLQNPGDVASPWEYSPLDQQASPVCVCVCVCVRVYFILRIRSHTYEMK